MADEREDSQVDRAKMRVMLERLQSDMHEQRSLTTSVLASLQSLKETIISEFHLRLSQVEARLKLIEDAAKTGEDTRKRWVAMVVNHGFTVATGLLVAYLALKGGCK